MGSIRLGEALRRVVGLFNEAGWALPVREGVNRMQCRGMSISAWRSECKLSHGAVMVRESKTGAGLAGDNVLPAV